MKKGILSLLVFVIPLSSMSCMLFAEINGSKKPKVLTAEKIIFPETNEKTNKKISVTLPEVFTGEPVNITTNSATVAGKVVSEVDAIVDRGFYWDTIPDPLANGNQVSLGEGPATFSIDLENLEIHTTYYVIAYVGNEYGTGFGDIRSFTTLAELPVVVTAEATDITPSEATIAGKVVFDGGAEILEQGWFLSSSPDPVANSEPIADETGETTFYKRVFNLLPNTTYYLVAYAKNIQGMGYGEILSFKTLIDTPMVVTSSPAEITGFSAILGGEVISGGGGEIIERGIYFGPDPNPVDNGNLITEGTGLGFFTIDLEDLDPKTLYYVVAFASNNSITAYGNIKSFQTEPVYSLKFMPNAFMPDSHIPENRVFKPTFYVLPETYTMQIFNRWGAEIFLTNQPGEGWDGRYKNKDAPKGSYLYKLFFVDEQGKAHKKTGTLTLVR